MNARTLVTHSSAFTTATWYPSLGRTSSRAFGIFCWYCTTDSTDCNPLWSAVITKVGAAIRGRTDSILSDASTFPIPTFVSGFVELIILSQYSICSFEAGEPSLFCWEVEDAARNPTLELTDVIGVPATTSVRVCCG